MTRRVLHVLSQRPGWTGSGVALDAIVRAAEASGWEQHAVVGTPGEEPSPRLSTLDDSHIRPLVFDRPPLSFPLPGMSDVMPYRSSRFSTLSESQLASYRQAWREHVERAIRSVAPTVIHSHHLWLLSALLKDVSDLPVVTHCHGTGLRQLSLCPHLAEEVRRGCRRNDRFVVLHQGHADALHRDFRIPEQRIRVIGSGFRPEVFHSEGRVQPTRPIVAYAGKLSNSKGLPWLLDAIDELSSRRPDLQLHIAGSGAGEEAVAIRERLRTMPNAIAHGQLDQAELADLLRRSTVFALPSFFEGLPLVLVEAAACGCRIVATQLPGVTGQLAPSLGEALTLVPLPRMKRVDQPVAEDLPSFVAGLVQTIDDALSQPPLRDPSRLVADMTWQGVFSKIEAEWLAVSEK